MKYIGHKKEIVINIDEAKYLANQPLSWNRNTLQDQKILFAQATLKLYEAARKDTHVGTNVAYDKTVEL